MTPTGNLSQTAQALLDIPLIDISMILAYLWIWAGFTMVVIWAGLAALDREARGCARRRRNRVADIPARHPIPMLAPVLTVVLVTMVINVLKIFDIVINLGADNSGPGGQASTLASDVYNYGFGGGVHTGLASALAVVLFILVVPTMLFNLKRSLASDHRNRCPRRLARPGHPARPGTSAQKELDQPFPPITVGGQRRVGRDRTVLADAEPVHADHLVPPGGAL